MNKLYKEFHIRTSPFIPELLSGLLWELDISGLTEENEFLKVFSAGIILQKENIEFFLEKLKNEKLFVSYSVEEYDCENKNWNEEWEKSLDIIKVTDRIVIKPSSKEYNIKANEIVMTIDPKMSFGTGEHPTTKLMLKLIEKYLQPGMKVLDVGSGTAILAIASIKLGAGQALAIDIDELCFENGRENCLLNEVGEKVIIRTGEIKEIKEEDFDLILANIQKNVLISIADEIKNRTKENGLLILSGLLSDDEKDIFECYSRINFTFVEKKSMDGWIALVFRF